MFMDGIFNRVNTIATKVLAEKNQTFYQKLTNYTQNLFENAKNLEKSKQT